jgi:hypothetical protein
MVGVARYHEDFLFLFSFFRRSGSHGGRAGRRADRQTDVLGFFFSILVLVFLGVFLFLAVNQVSRPVGQSVDRVQS